MFSLCALTHLGELRVHAFPPIDVDKIRGCGESGRSASMIMATMEKRVHTELTEDSEVMENYF